MPFHIAVLRCAARNLSETDCVSKFVEVKFSAVMEDNVGVEILPDGAIQVWYLGECQKLQPEVTEEDFYLQKVDFGVGFGWIRVWVASFHGVDLHEAMIEREVLEELEHEAFDNMQEDARDYLV